MLALAGTEGVPCGGRASEGGWPLNGEQRQTWARRSRRGEGSRQTREVVEVEVTPAG